MSLTSRLAALAVVLVLIVATFVTMERRRSAEIAGTLREVHESQIRISLAVEIDDLIDREIDALEHGDGAAIAALSHEARQGLAQLRRSVASEGDGADELAIIAELERSQDSVDGAAVDPARRHPMPDVHVLLHNMLASEQKAVAKSSATLERHSAISAAITSTLIAILVVAMVLGVVVPLRRYMLRIIASTRRIAEGDLSTPVETQGPADLSELGNAIDVMRSRLGETLGIQQRIAELERFDAALRASELRYRTLFDANPLPMWMYDAASDQIHRVNDVFVALHGSSRDELVAMRLSDVFDGAHLLCRDGKRIELELTSHEIIVDDHPYVLSVGVDVTEARLIESQLRQAQKLEAVGQLAGGVAHDFNNILAVIQMNAELLGDALAPDHPASEDVKEIAIAAQRGARLTRQLLSFSRKDKLDPTSLLLNDTVTDVHKMLDRIVGDDIEIALTLSSKAGVVHADAGQLEQVLMNLVVNARDAMPGGGKITIETAYVELARQRAVKLGLKRGTYSVLSVHDTGSGMDEHTLSKIFEPFFTTKEVGKGTGLGLANVFGIVAQSHGAIEVESTVGVGSTFRIYLPRLADDLQTNAATQPIEKLPARGGSATILIVEDEEQVRTALKRMLSSWGFRCLEARNGDAALELLERCRDRVDLMITDLVMPGLNGRELAAHVRRTRPSMKVVVMSGYTEHPTISSLAAPDEHFVAKPFSAISMLAAIRGTLGAGASRESQNMLRVV